MTPGDNFDKDWREVERILHGNTWENYFEDARRVLTLMKAIQNRNLAALVQTLQAREVKCQQALEHMQKCQSQRDLKTAETRKRIPSENELSKMTVKNLKALANDLNIPTSKKRKADLIHEFVSY